MILNEFDYNKIAVINPRDLVRRRDDMPKVAVTCFSRATFDRMLDAFGGQKVTIRSLANLDITVYETLYKDAKVALFLSPVGAPACALLLEDIFALGVEKLDGFGCSYSEGKTWTTDAFYRETPDKMKARKSQGCICVDMECSAVAAVKIEKEGCDR